MSKQVETPITAKRGKRKAENIASGEKRSKKKQVITVSDSESDVEPTVLDITASGKKRIGGRRIPANIPPAPMDGVSFHSEESAQKWSSFTREELLKKENSVKKLLNAKRS
jgi:hypothetical protein